MRVTAFEILSLAAIAGSLYLIAGLLTNVSGAAKAKPKDIERSGRQLPALQGVDERAPVSDFRAISGMGVIEPRLRETKLAAPGAGLIERIAVEEGQSVRRGQVLVEFEARAERASLATAVQDLEKAHRDLERVRAGERSETIDALRQDFKAAQARAAQSHAIAERLSALATKDLVTRDEFDRARRTADQDAASAAASGSRLAAIASGPRADDIAIQQALVTQANLRIEEKRAALQLRRVTSPIDGKILQIKYRAGEYYVPGGEALMLIGDLSRRRARIDVDERDIGRLRLGLSGYLTAPGYPDRRFPVTLVEIGNRIGRKNVRSDDPKERIDTKILEVLLELEPTADLLPGLRVTAVLDGKAAAQ